MDEPDQHDPRDAVPYCDVIGAGLRNIEAKTNL